MSAVVQSVAIETIYDHRVTVEELNRLYFGEPEEKEEYFHALSQDSAFADLVRLYKMRGDFATAEAFIDKIQDRQLRNEFRMIPCCETGRFLAERSVSR